MKTTKDRGMISRDEAQMIAIRKRGLCPDHQSAFYSGGGVIRCIYCDKPVTPKEARDFIEFTAQRED